ncbi:MAG: hypothetical protein KJ950_06295 [Proteobacteria bacterium]|nr:hypothetical protein [Pseudomonadota bacterium]MBU1688728.1 hypothetical protein [Pseudomonadota bacterium]
MKNIAWFVVLVSVLSLFLHACGGGSASNQSSTVPGAVVETISSTVGGSIATSDNGFVMNIEAGALDQDTQITITPQVDAQDSVSYALEPEGLVFNIPVEVTVQTNPEVMGGLEDTTGQTVDVSDAVVAPFTELESSATGLELLQENISNLVGGNNSLQVVTEVGHFSMLTIRNPKATVVADSSIGFALSHPANEAFALPIDINILKNSTANQDITLSSVSYDSFTSTIYGAVTQDSSVNSALQQAIINANSGQAWWGDSSIYTPLPITNNSIGSFMCTHAGSGQIQLDLVIRYQGTIGAGQASFDHRDTMSLQYQVDCTEELIQTTTTTAPSTTTTASATTTTVAVTTSTVPVTTTTVLVTTTSTAIPTTTTTVATTTTTTVASPPYSGVSTYALNWLSLDGFGSGTATLVLAASADGTYANAAITYDTGSSVSYYGTITGTTFNASINTASAYFTLNFTDATLSVFSGDDVHPSYHDTYSSGSYSSGDFTYTP